MEFTIDEKYEDARFDRFLRNHFPDTPLDAIFRGIRKGLARVNGKKAKENYHLRRGDQVSADFTGAIGNKAEGSEKKPPAEKELPRGVMSWAEIQSGIVFENDDILVYNKAPGVVMHKGSGHEVGLSELIKSYTENPEFNFVNRIDKSTSGLVLGSKKLTVTRALSQDIRRRDITKRYYILVHGEIAERHFTLRNWLRKEEERVVVLPGAEPGAREAVSHFRVLRKRKGLTLLAGELESGRTHQLRVQLAARGNPVVGDGKYGEKEKGETLYLFSCYLKIPRYNLELELPAPERFIKRMGNERNKK